MAGPAARHAGLDDAVGNLQGEDRVKADAVALQGFGLSDGTGTPSRMKPPAQSGSASRSWMIPMMISSGTSLPASI